MATKSKIVESSFRTGAGRYIQEDGAALLLGREIKFLKCAKPFIVYGQKALQATCGKIERSLTEEKLAYVLHCYSGFCEKEKCLALSEEARKQDCDCIVGVGGGNVCDAAKLIASYIDVPVITVPTSSATCAAFTPLSVCYNALGQTVGSVHHKREVNCVLADNEILCRQPVRLFVAGVYDAVAKYPEITQRLKDKAPSDTDVGLNLSYVLSKHIYSELLDNLPLLCKDLEEQKNTKALSDAVYITIAATGIVSGMARGSNQCAVAHKFYECSRTLYPDIVKERLHGELVAMGLLVQTAYNGDDCLRFREQMKRHGLPVTVAEIGLPAETSKQALFEKIAASSAMAGCDEQELQRLKKSLEILY